MLQELMPGRRCQIQNTRVRPLQAPGYAGTKHLK